LIYEAIRIAFRVINDLKLHFDPLQLSQSIFNAPNNRLTNPIAAIAQINLDANLRICGGPCA
jgi:hypothetical protein